MFTALWFKEAIKLKRLLIIAAIAHLGVLLYVLLTLRIQFEMVNAVKVWTTTLDHQLFFFEELGPTLLLTAIVMGIAQFVPEVEKKRFRIACHLPVNTAAMSLAMVLFGLVVLLVLALIDTLAVWGMGLHFYPQEIATAAAGVLLHWTLAAMAAYLLAATLTLEPRWLTRLGMACTTLPLFTLMLIDVLRFQFWATAFCAVIAALLLTAIVEPALRFRRGV